jgi:ribosomal protein L37AE/L43A
VRVLLTVTRAFGVFGLFLSFSGSQIRKSSLAIEDETADMRHICATCATHHSSTSIRTEFTYLHTGSELGNRSLF